MESQSIRDEDGMPLRDKNLINQRLAKFVQSLLKAKMEKMDPAVAFMRPRQRIDGKLGAEQTEGEIALALRVIANF